VHPRVEVGWRGTDGHEQGQGISGHEREYLLTKTVFNTFGISSVTLIDRVRDAGLAVDC
jgi:hypothetical protein